VSGIEVGSGEEEGVVVVFGGGCGMVEKAWGHGLFTVDRGV